MSARDRQRREGRSISSPWHWLPRPLPSSTRVSSDSSEVVLEEEGDVEEEEGRPISPPGAAWLPGPSSPPLDPLPPLPSSAQVSFNRERQCEGVLNSGYVDRPFSPLPSSARASSNPPPSFASSLPGADIVNVLLEELCRNEFGFELGDLKESLRLQAEELQSSLLCFCEEALSTHDPAQRHEVAKTFITGIAKITQLATDRSNCMLVNLQSTFLKKMKSENNMLRKELAQVQDKLLEKEGNEANAHRRIEEEKALLREELQACQICLRNPRNVIIMPCLHAQYCEDCMEAHQRNHNTCPTCRGIIRCKLPYIA